MLRPLALLVIGLIFGGLFGFVFAAANGITLDGHDHAEHGSPGRQSHTMGSAADGHTAHDAMVELPRDDTIPTLDIAVTPDPHTGWNLALTTTGFRFVPEHAGHDHIPGEGHAHVYVNGEKIARLYGTWMHIASLPGGDNLIEVTLNANSHGALAVEGTPVRASVTLTVD